jgi:hypothetical protein
MPFNIILMTTNEQMLKDLPWKKVNLKNFRLKNLLYLTCKSLISCYFSEHFPLTSQLRKHRLILIPYQENERY